MLFSRSLSGKGELKPGSSEGRGALSKARSHGELVSDREGERGGGGGRGREGEGGLTILNIDTLTMRSHRHSNQCTVGLASPQELKTC